MKPKEGKCAECGRDKKLWARFICDACVTGMNKRKHKEETYRRLVANELKAKEVMK